MRLEKLPPDHYLEGPDDIPLTEALVRINAPVRPQTPSKSSMVVVLYRLKLTEDATATGLLEVIRNKRIPEWPRTSGRIELL